MKRAVMATASVHSPNYSLTAALARNYSQSQGPGQGSTTIPKTPVTMVSMNLRSLQDSTAGLRATNTDGYGGQTTLEARAILDSFTEEATKVIVLAKHLAKRLGDPCLRSDHILLALMDEGTGISARVLKYVSNKLRDAALQVEEITGTDARSAALQNLEIPFSSKVKRVFELSLGEAVQLGRRYIGPEHILLGLLQEGVLRKLGVDSDSIRSQIIRMVASGNNQSAEEAVSSAPSVLGRSGSCSNKIPTPTLEEYGTNLTKLAKEGKLNPIVGRQYEIDFVIQILGRRTKNNPCLIGRRGVGKTAIVEGLAQRIVTGDVPKKIQGKTVLKLDMGRLVGGRKFIGGEYEKRLGKLMEEIKQSDDHNVILFIDDLDTLIGAGAVEEAALVRGGLQYIGATTTLYEYNMHIKKDSALGRRFLPVEVLEPSVDETIEILKGLRKQYETYHTIHYTDESLAAAAKLSHKYMYDRLLPDKAIDLIDQAGCRVPQLEVLKEELRKIIIGKKAAITSQEFEKAVELCDKEKGLRAEISALVEKEKEMRKGERSESGDDGPVVTEFDILQTVSSWTRIPVEELSIDESDEEEDTDESDEESADKSDEESSADESDEESSTDESDDEDESSTDESDDDESDEESTDESDDEEESTDESDDEEFDDESDEEESTDKSDDEEESTDECDEESTDDFY